MAEERDAKVSQHYRGLQALEPPPELDQTIVSTSRRVVSSPGRHRWYYSLAAAAVLVFAVALTLHIERQRPDAEGLPQAAAPQLRLERELRGVIKPPAETVRPGIARAADPRSGFAPEPPASAADALAAAAAAPQQEPAPAAPAVAARRLAERRKSEAPPQMQLRREETLARQYAPAPAAVPIL